MGKRHRRTKAEMEAFRALSEKNGLVTEKPKVEDGKRHRRTKVEMEALRKTKDDAKNLVLEMANRLSRESQEEKDRKEQDRKALEQRKIQEKADREAEKEAKEQRRLEKEAEKAEKEIPVFTSKPRNLDILEAITYLREKYGQSEGFIHADNILLVANMCEHLMMENKKLKVGIS